MADNSSFFFEWQRFVRWSYSGVNHSLAGNGGIDCVNFLSPKQRIIETVIFTTFHLFEIFYFYPSCKLPSKIPTGSTWRRNSGRRNFFVVIMCLVFGIEVGFKLSTSQFIYLMNPCHVVTMLQIYLLVAPPTHSTMAFFRVHNHMLFGATLALVLPVTNTRFLPLEPEIYYLQHLLLLIIPYYLMRIGGVYSAEKLSDMSWDIFTHGFMGVYHWLVLQPVGLLTQVNLNNMVCPALSDPFSGQWYRIWASGHQTALVLLHGKFLTMVYSKILPVTQNEESESSCDKNGYDFVKQEYSKND